MNHIALIRSASSAVSKKQYNIQEIGMAKELSRLGMKVDVFLISDTGKTYKEEIKDNVRVYWLKGIKIPGQQGYYKDLKKILDCNEYDMIQALDDSQITTVLVSYYCKNRGIKFVLWQGMYENYQEMYKKIIQRLFDFTLLKILKKNTKYCIAKTTSARKYLEMKGFHNAKVIPVGLAIENFANESRIDYRLKLNIPEGYKILLYVGKVEERRKPIFCLDVFAEVKKMYKDCCLVYVGNGPMLEETHSYVEKHGYKDIYFVDKIPQKELSSLYEEASLFILPTRYEIFGMVLMEAMYFKLPVITYKAVGPLDIIENNIDGIVMDNFDSKKWANKILLHIKDKNYFEEMGIKGRKKIINNYLWPHIGKMYYEEYRNIIEH